MFFLVLCTLILISLLKADSDVIVRARYYIEQLKSIVNPQPSGSTIPQSHVHDVVVKAKSTLTEFASIIRDTEDPIRLEELLDINDQLLTLLKKAPAKLKENLKLTGLGISMDGRPDLVIDRDGKLDGLPPLNGRPNGYFGSVENGPESGDSTETEEDDEMTPTTPKIDKGKRKAEPELTEMVLSPKTFIMGEPESNDGAGYVEEVISPSDRYGLGIWQRL